MLRSPLDETRPYPYYRVTSYVLTTTTTTTTINLTNWNKLR